MFDKRFIELVQRNHEISEVETKGFSLDLYHATWKIAIAFDLLCKVQIVQLTGLAGFPYQVSVRLLEGFEFRSRISSALTGGSVLGQVWVEPGDNVQ